MTRRFLVVTVCLVATVAFLIGLIVAGSMTPAPAQSATKPGVTAVRPAALATSGPGVASFADVAEHLNPAVVNIDATARAGARSRAGAERAIHTADWAFLPAVPDADRPARLYHKPDDLWEVNDLAARHPDECDRLAGLLDQPETTR